MTDRRYRYIFGAALVVAGTATFASYRLLGAALAPKQEATRMVVVASGELPAGALISHENVTVAAWPARLAPSGTFLIADSVIGRVTRVALSAGEPVSTARLAPVGTPAGLEGTISPDHRAIVVRVSEATGMSGVLRTDSRVDVLTTTRVEGSETGVVARLVMRNVRVLGVGPARPTTTAAPTGDALIGSSSAGASVVTLEVTPAQAEQLAVAETQGSIQLALRGYGSVDGATTGATGTMSVGAVVGAEPSMLPGHVGVGVRPPTPAASHAAPTHAGVAHAPAPSRPTPAAEEQGGEALAAALAAATGAPAAPAAAPAARSDGPVVRVFRGGQVTEVRAEPIEPAGVVKP